MYTKTYLVCITLFAKHICSAMPSYWMRQSQTDHHKHASIPHTISSTLLHLQKGKNGRAKEMTKGSRKRRGQGKAKRQRRNEDSAKKSKETSMYSYQVYHEKQKQNSTPWQIKNSGKKIPLAPPEARWIWHCMV